MKEIALFSKYTYSCQLCGQDLETDVEQDIILGQKPICSNSCGYKLIYRILNEYPQKILIEMYKVYFPKKKQPKELKFLIFEISNEIAKPILSSLIPVAHGSAQKNMAQKVELAHGSNPIYEPYRVEPSRVEPVNELEPVKRKEILKQGYSKDWASECLNCSSCDCHAYSDFVVCFTCKLRRKA